MAIEDAVSGPTPVWVPPRIHTAWRPAWGYQGDGSVDDLSGQQGPSASIGQSLDDGLPDTVTMTSGNDAVGTLEMDLTGRGPIIATSVGWRTARSGTQFTSDDEVYADWPLDLQAGDVVISTFACVPAVTDEIFTTDDLSGDPNEPRVTVKLADYTEPSALGGMRVLVFATIAPPGEAGFSFGIKWANASNYRWAWSSSAVYAQSGGFNVGISPGIPVVADPGTSGTISGLSVEMAAVRGYLYTAWLTRDTTLSGSDTTESNVISADPANADVRLLTQRTAIIGQGTYTRSATKGVSNAYGVGVGIPLYIWDRPTMDPRQYFSAFNPDSPVVDLPRDIAPVTYDFGALDTTGPVYQRIFTGQMNDVPVKSRTATLNAVSAARLRMMKAVQPPTIWGAREGANLSWILTWIWYQCGMSVAPKPSTDTRFWAPMHGSLRAVIGTPDGVGNRTDVFDSTGTVLSTPPRWVDGPYVLGMYGERSAVRTVQNRMTWQPAFEVPSTTRDAIDPTSPRDLLSKNGGIGRLSMWVRGDATLSSLPYTDGANELMTLNIILEDRPFTVQRAVIAAHIRKSNRKLSIRFIDMSGNDTLWESSLVLPTDGAWHFCSWSWDWPAGLMKVRLDAAEEARVGAVTTDDTDLPDGELGYLNDTDATGMWGYLRCLITATLPIADVYVDSGITVYTDPYLPDIGHVPDVITRPLDQALEAVLEPVAREAWGIMVDIAQASLSSYRTDELDRINFLPLGWFGEDEQMDPQTVVINTERNAEDPDVEIDPTRIRNNVTVQFDETRVDTLVSPILDFSSVVTINPGQTDMVFTLDTETAFIEGVGNTSLPFDVPMQQLINLSAADVAAGGAPVPSQPFMSVNVNDSGTGDYMQAYQVRAVIQSYDSGSVVIRFTNNTGAKRYLVNNGEEVPFMRIFGNAVRQSTGYVTTSDPTSIARRGERALSAEIPYVQRREDATMISGRLTAMLCSPVGSTEITVFGDPTRTPGQLVTVADAQGTNISGTWRIMSVDHTRDVAAYTQDLGLVQQAPTALWDESNWDESVWGE